MPENAHHQNALKPLILAALHSDGLLAPNEFHLTRYSLNPQTRNRLLDPDIFALEDYLIDHCGLPDAEFDLHLLTAFGDVVYGLTQDEGLSLQISYQRMVWLLQWLNIHHPPSFFGEDPDSPLQSLQMAAALGIAEWAAAFNQLGDGMDYLMRLAESPLERVRDASAQGVGRLLDRTWAPAVRRFRYQELGSNTAHWAAMIGGVAYSTFQPQQLPDVFYLLGGALQAFAGSKPSRASDELAAAIRLSLEQTQALHPQFTAAQINVWRFWNVQAITTLFDGLQN